MNDTLAIPATQTRADWRTPLELLALGAIWGGSFLFMRVAASDFGPLALVEVRIVLGALFLMPFLWRIRARIDARLWLRFAIVGALNSAIPFTLFAWGAERAPAGIGAIVYLVIGGSWIGFTAYVWLLANVPAAKAATYAYVNPVIALILGWWLLDEALTPPILLGSAIIVVAVALVTTARVAPRASLDSAPEPVLAPDSSRLG